MHDGPGMKPSEFESIPISIGQWRGWNWHAHFLIWVFPVALLIVAASDGSAGLSQQTAKILCWLSAVALQVILCPRLPWHLVPEPDDDLYRMTIWPMGIWHDSRLSSLWRIHRQGAVSVLIPALANAMVAIACALILGLWNVQSSWNPVHIDGPWFLDGREVLPWSFFWWLGQLGHMHWVLALAAVIPAMPMTGGQVIALILDQTSWRETESRGIRRNFAIGSAAVLSVAGLWLVLKGENAGYILLLLGLMIGIEIRRQARMDAALAFIEAFIASDLNSDDDDDDDEMHSYYSELAELTKLTSGNPWAKAHASGVSPFDHRIGLLDRVRHWYHSRRTRHQLNRMESERIRQISDAQQLDKILVQIHEQGIESLARKQRRFLARISNRMRDQNNQDV